MTIDEFNKAKDLAYREVLINLNTVYNNPALMPFVELRSKIQKAALAFSNYNAVVDEYTSQ